MKESQLLEFRVRASGVGVVEGESEPSRAGHGARGQGRSRSLLTGISGCLAPPGRGREGWGECTYLGEELRKRGGSN